MNRTDTTLVVPSGNVTLIATLQAGDGFTLTSPEASSTLAGPWQTLGTYATPGPRTVTFRATDNAGHCFNSFIQRFRSTLSFRVDNRVDNQP